ncbi:Uncharacterized protein HZ326_26900 [Fusarium oxysporum f. sp. albedinis]|nr:Uncharacterized protein HZ326_26900 [Fusarium oxysporum f. sp. albedinis]
MFSNAFFLLPFLPHYQLTVLHIGQIYQFRITCSSTPSKQPLSQVELIATPPVSLISSALRGPNTLDSTPTARQDEGVRKHENRGLGRDDGDEGREVREPHQERDYVGDLAISSICRSTKGSESVDQVLLRRFIEETRIEEGVELRLEAFKKKKKKKKKKNREELTPYHGDLEDRLISGVKKIFSSTGPTNVLAVEPSQLVVLWLTSYSPAMRNQTNNSVLCMEGGLG